jgi:hypothetical protein
MLQVKPVHLVARILPNHLVALVDDVENFLAHKQRRRRGIFVEIKSTISF